MQSKSIFSLFLPLLLAALGNAHGEVSQVSSGGVTIKAPNIYYDGDALNSKTAVRKMYRSDGAAFVRVQDFSNNAKMSCEEASGAPATLKVKAGDSVEVQWVGSTSELVGQGGTGGATKPFVHGMGPVLDYIASCNGDCSSFDATWASWVKIQEFGIDNSQTISDALRSALNNKPEPYYPKGSGLWGAAKLIQDGSKWYINVPKALKNGQYLLRHEVAALHSNKVAGDSSSGPQNYIACIQIDVTDGGDTTLPEGTLAGSLYDPNGDFANFNVYSSANAAQGFKIPGPAVWDQVSSGSTNSGSTNSGSGSSSNNSGYEEEEKGDAAVPAPVVDAVTSAAGEWTATQPVYEAPATTVTSAEPTAPLCRRRKRRSVVEPPSRNHMRGLKKRLAEEAF